MDASEDDRCTKTGFPLPGYEYRTLTVDTGKPVPPNVFGELYVRGYGVMLGYYGKPAETAAVLDADGWFRTGDRAVIDDDGFLHYAGRYKDMLRIGGENVDPSEVEAFLEGHPDIASIKVVSAPDERQGEVLVACIIPREGREVSLESVREFCLAKIASFKVPRRVVAMESFPMTTTGKVQRSELKNLVLGPAP
jgi:fatty-acyl-CoA synthase